MPKSSKKKKEKAADFSKAKLKLGKGKQAPSNVVDTSFKARSIALPSQSIAQSADVAAPTTKRKLTLDDLLAHLKHYNPGTRKDALFGMRELFEEHPQTLLASLTAVVNGCVRIIGDEDSSVRKTLLGFMGWLLPRMSFSDLAPHAPVLLLFTTSAQTHIFPEIRIDAIRFLDLLLQQIPSIVVEGWARNSSGHGKRVLEGYLGILNAGTAFGEGGEKVPPQATSTASVILSPASKLVVLKSLSVFLATAVISENSPHRRYSLAQDTPTWYFGPSFSSMSAFESFDNLIRPILGKFSLKDTRSWSGAYNSENSEENFVTASSWGLERLENEVTIESLSYVERSAEDGESSSGDTVRSAQLLQIARTLQPTLISTFLDSAPSVFSPSTVPSETELQLVLAVAEIAKILYGSISSHSCSASKSQLALYEGVNTFIGHMAPYFPFTIDWPSTARRDIKIEEAFQSLNLIFCELASLLMLADAQDPSLHSFGTRSSRSSSKRTANRSTHISSIHVSRVREYVVAVLRGEASVAKGAQSPLSRGVVPSAYNALLPTIWALITNQESHHLENDEDVLAAVIEHALKAGSKSAVKRHTIEFLGRLILLEGVSSMSERQTVISLQDWLLHLPKTLWELGGNDLTTTEVILRLLLRLLQRRSSLLDNTVLPSLRTRLAPYFTINHASRGKLRGPFNKLPPDSSLRLLVLDVVHSSTFASQHDELDGALRGAISDAESLYWMSLV